MSMAGRLSGHYIRKRLRTAGWARRIAGFSGVLLVVGILVYRFGGIDFAALKLVLAVVLGLASLALLLSLAGLARVWHSGHEGGGKAVGALAIALLVALPFIGAGLLAVENPAANRAETDGMLAADISDGADLNDALPGAGTGPTIDGRQVQARAAQVYVLVRKVLADEGWQIEEVATAEPEDIGTPAPGSNDLGISGTIDIPLPTARDAAAAATAADPFARPESREYTIRAVATGPVLALPSDITIRIVEDATLTYVDLRATSRLVDWDLGQNRRFVEDFLAALDVALAGLAAIGPVGEG